MDFNLEDTKRHYEAFGHLPLEAMHVLFELAEKQLAPTKAEADELEAKPARKAKTVKADA